MNLNKINKLFWMFAGVLTLEGMLLINFQEIIVSIYPEQKKFINSVVAIAILAIIVSIIGSLA